MILFMLQTLRDEYRILLNIQREKVSLFHIFILIPKKLLRLPTFTSFHSIHVQKFAKNFRGCEVIYEKCETFLPQTISDIWYTTNSLSIPSVLQLYHCKIVKHIFDSDSDNDVVT